MKKVSLLGFILAATTAQLASAEVAVSDGAVAVAQPQPGCPKAFQGFHLGGNIGYAVGWSKFRRNSFDNDGSTASANHIRGFRGVDGGIGVGYTHRLCNWALGIEFDANWANTKGNYGVQTDNGNFSHKARLKNSLQLLGRLGYVMREIAMPFVGLGWDNSRWNQTANLNVPDFTEANGDFFEGFSESGKKGKRINAFLWKAGVDFLATKHVVVGFEYTGTYGGKQRLTSRDQTFTTRFKPQNNKFALTAKIVY